MKCDRPILALMALGMTLLVACSAEQPNSNPPGGSTPANPATDARTPDTDSSNTDSSNTDSPDADSPVGIPDSGDNIPTENPWNAVLGDTTMPLWAVTPCDGTSPFLCVSDTEGNLVGTVEFQVWTMQERPDVVQALTDVGLDPISLDPQNPAQREPIVAALTILVEDLYATVAEDHAASGGGATLAIEAPAEVQMGSLPALLYRIDHLGNDSIIQQKTAGYMALDGDRLYVITTAAAFEEPPGFSSVEQLHAFLPYLNIVVGRLKI